MKNHFKPSIIHARKKTRAQKNITVFSRCYMEFYSLLLQAPQSSSFFLTSPGLKKEWIKKNT